MLVISALEMAIRPDYSDWPRGIANRELKLETLPHIVTTSLEVLEEDDVKFITASLRDAFIATPIVPQLPVQLRLQDRGKVISILLGQMVMLKIRDVEPISSMVTVHICVQETDYIRASIFSMSMHAQQCNVHTGYFLTEVPASPAYVKVSSWYRPLNLSVCREHGFAILVPSVPGMTDIARLERLVYETTSPIQLGHITASTTVQRILDTASREITIIPDMSMGKWIGNLTVAACYKDHPVVTTTDRPLRAARLTFFEGETAQDLIAVFDYLSREGYDVVYGISMGAMVGMENTARLIRKTMYLNFVNLTLPPVTAADVAVCTF